MRLFFVFTFLVAINVVKGRHVPTRDDKKGGEPTLRDDLTSSSLQQQQQQHVITKRHVTGTNADKKQIIDRVSKSGNGFKRHKSKKWVNKKATARSRLLVTKDVRPATKSLIYGNDLLQKDEDIKEYKRGPTRGDMDYEFENEVFFL